MERKMAKENQTSEEILHDGRELLQQWILSEKTPENDRLDIEIKPEDIKPCVKALVDARWGYLSAITAMDHPEYVVAEETKEKTILPDKGNIELLYHFCEGPAIISLRVALPYNNPKMDSICEIIPSATLYEREAIELIGVEYIGTPSTEHLLLPDEWPANVYPLRKAFTGLEKAKKSETGE
jgi:NADH:ubiquinone oxidoreductase subunit C